MKATRKLAAYANSLTYADLPAGVIGKCKELILDALACGLGGSRTPIGGIVTEFARQLGGPPDALVLGSDLRCACTASAYANASVINALDYDDTGKAGHPGSSIIAAVISLAEKNHLGGKDVLLACVTGYEIATRVARAIEPSWERYQQVHGIGSAQTFGSAAACAKLLKLDLDQTLNAFGIAGASAPVAHAGKFGWTDKSIHFVKDNVAWPAEAGLRAAVLAGMGYEGSESILDGDRGFWVMAGSDRCDFDILVDFSRFEILDISLKPYPCCRWIHTTLDALGEIRSTHAIEPEAVAAVDVHSNQPLADFFGRQLPRSFVDVEFSVPCSVALHLFQVPHSQWHDKANWQDSRIQDLASRVRVYLDESYQRLYLELNRASARIPTRVEVTLKEGRTLSAYCDLASGSPDKPMTREERLFKVYDLMEGLIEESQSKEVIDAVQQLDAVSNIRDLMTRLAVNEKDPL